MRLSAAQRATVKTAMRPGASYGSGLSDPAQKFVAIWTGLGGPKLEREFRFHPTRRWRADFHVPETRVLIEIEGGIFKHGRHNRGKGYREDAIKYNAAVSMGFRLFRLCEGMFTREHIAPILAAVGEPTPPLSEKEQP